MKLQGLEHRIERRGQVIARVYQVELIRYPPGGMPRHELPDRLRIELTPGYAQGMRGTFRSVEDFVPDGDRGLHALSMIRVIPACKRSLLFSIQLGWSLPREFHTKAPALDDGGIAKPLAHGIHDLFDIAFTSTRTAKKVVLDNLIRLDQFLRADSDQPEGPAIGFSSKQRLGSPEQGPPPFAWHAVDGDGA